MLILREDDVKRLLPMADAIQAVAGAFTALAAGEASNHTRRRMFLPTGSVLHQMAAWWRGY